MATNPTTDLTEEDAADLQFPKECSKLFISGNNNNNNSFETCPVCSSIPRMCACLKCSKCLIVLQMPYIQCTECNTVRLCCICFANGSEFEQHKSDHRYRVVKNDFVLFEHSTWAAEEELIMLDILFIYGYGNWEMIADKLKNRSEWEVKQQYDRFYLNKPMAMLPRIPETVQSAFPSIVVPFRFRLVNSDEPPRHATHSIGYQSIAGYNAARSDFESDYDPNAEQLLVQFSENVLDPKHPSYYLLTDLQFAIVQCYNRRLRERARRKRIIREHGLILYRKTMSWMHRYDRTLTRSLIERMFCFQQFFTGYQFDFFIEGLHHAAELKQRILRLCEYRRNGIKTLQAAEIYERINQQRENHRKSMNAFKLNPFFVWKCLNNSVSLQMENVPNRRGQFKPLDIVALPGYEKLLAKERELCSKVRLVPETYVELKQLLIEENNKFGYLKLQTARRMLKIDVNKTRKLYDFLVAEGYIAKPHN